MSGDSQAEKKYCIWKRNFAYQLGNLAFYCIHISSRNWVTLAKKKRQKCGIWRNLRNKKKSSTEECVGEGNEQIKHSKEE